MNPEEPDPIPKNILQCPRCDSTNINQYRMPTGAIWCEGCSYVEYEKEKYNPFYIRKGYESYKEMLRDFLEGLEFQNIDDLMKYAHKNEIDFKKLGGLFALKVKENKPPTSNIIIDVLKKHPKNTFQSKY